MIRIVYPLLVSLDEYLLLATSFVLPIICGLPLASSEVGMDHVSVKKMKILLCYPDFGFQPSCPRGSISTYILDLVP